MPPTVSVIMPVYNGEKYLKKALKSIQDQTLTDFEFIILDDASTDSTRTIVEEFAQRDTRIRLCHNEKNLGLTEILNRGLELARGEYIARMDQDDISLPGRLGAQVKYLNEHPKTDVLGTAFTLIDEQENHVQDIRFPKEHDLIRWFLCFYNPIVHPSVMMRRSTIINHKGYDTSIMHAEDYDLWWRVGFDGKLENLESIHILLRKHSSQVSSKYRDEQFEVDMKIVQKHVSLTAGKTIPVDIFRRIWKNDCSSAGEAMAVSNFLFDYMNITIKDMENKTHRKLISKDAFRKIRNTLIPYFAKPQVWLFCLNLLHQNARLNRRDNIQAKDARI